MRTETAGPILLKDYKPSDYNIETVDLCFRLNDSATAVVSTLKIAPNPLGMPGAPLRLVGDCLTLVSASLDGLELNLSLATPNLLQVDNPPSEPFRIQIETLLNPLANTQLMGLFRSSAAFCTQCEAEGFRRITYFLDRPDVLSIYTTRIEADKETCPVLLGNGNIIDQGDLEGARHYAVWHDPHPKPSYLFALVGGKLDSISDNFITASGRKVTLGIFVEPGKTERASYAMDALKRSMAWDEKIFGCEYDLDIFNIVAVSDFNMGAMENKGLNVFNDKFVLADPNTATDVDYAHIEAVIAHEYFHNWTGNRITCRDWFQLCLKEGLTVFRDQEFSSDERSRAVKRIQDVKNLRNVQFVEDAGPLSHNVRPESYFEISNFYTATIYEKGSEIVRMLKTLVGDEAFRTGMRLYFERCDGSAATVEDFLGCFAEVTGRNLDVFMRWYNQAGTPLVTVTTSQNLLDQTFTVTLQQSTASTPLQATKFPFLIPVRVGLVGEDGDMNFTLKASFKSEPTSDHLIELDEISQTLTFSKVKKPAVLSAFRGFSAPVNVAFEQTDADLLLLAEKDSDSFNRWQAIQNCAMRVLKADSIAGKASEAPQLAQAFNRLLDQAERDPAYAALMLTLPSEMDVARDIAHDVNPEAIRFSRESLRSSIASHIYVKATEIYHSLNVPGSFQPDARSAGMRALAATLLDYLLASGAPEALELAKRKFYSSPNMTDRMSALLALAARPGDDREEIFAAFYDKYKHEPLVIDKWLAAQAAIGENSTLDRVRQLCAHPAFSITNPNRVRALVGTFAMGNLSQFNRADGEGYRFVIDIIKRLDPLNPQVASRLLTSFRAWRSFEPQRQTHGKAALESLASNASLSSDVLDIVTRSLA